jgi:hypothetical protein
MQNKETNDIDFEIGLVLSELDKNRILSHEDRLELKDYFLTEIEELTALGLNTQEALIIAKKRFGVLDEVMDDYKKVNSGIDILRFGIIGVVGYCIIQLFSISINFISQIFWMVFYQFNSGIELYFYVFDVPLRVLLIFVMGWITSKYFTRVNFNSLASLWKFPIFYFLAAVISRLFYFMVPSLEFHIDVLKIKEFMSNEYIVNYSLLAFVMLFVSYKMYKMKILEMEYV